MSLSIKKISLSILDFPFSFPENNVIKLDFQYAKLFTSTLYTSKIEKNKIQAKKKNQNLRDRQDILKK